MVEDLPWPLAVGEGELLDLGWDKFIQILKGFNNYFAGIKTIYIYKFMLVSVVCSSYFGQLTAVWNLPDFFQTRSPQECTFAAV